MVRGGGHGAGSLAALARCRPSAVDAPRAMSRTVTRLCLDYIKSARARREDVGPWPLELPFDAGLYGGRGGAGARSSVVLMMLALERLRAERAAFLLHAMSLTSLTRRSDAGTQRGVLPTAECVAGARARARRGRASRSRGRSAHRRGLPASREGDLAPCGNCWPTTRCCTSDGGGKLGRTLRPVMGGDKVARFFAGIAGKPGGAGRGRGAPERHAAPRPDGLPRSISLDIQDGRIVAVTWCATLISAPCAPGAAPVRRTRCPYPPIDLNLPVLDALVVPARMREADADDWHDYLRRGSDAPHQLAARWPGHAAGADPRLCRAGAFRQHVAGDRRAGRQAGRHDRPERNSPSRTGAPRSLPTWRRRWGRGVASEACRKLAEGPCGTWLRPHPGRGARYQPGFAAGAGTLRLPAREGLLHAYREVAAHRATSGSTRRTGRRRRRG